MPDPLESFPDFQIASRLVLELRHIADNTPEKTILDFIDLVKVVTYSYTSVNRMLMWWK